MARKKAMPMTIPTRLKLETWGDDLAFRIPDETAAALGIKEGDAVALEREGSIVWVTFTHSNQPPDAPQLADDER